MATVIINNEEYQVKDGDLLTAPCEKAGIPFNCNTGICGSCLVKVLEGAENLSELTEEENDFGLDEKSRLACVCKILKGTVKLTF